MWYEKTAMILVAVGAINWGLAQLNFDLVQLIFGSWSALVATIVYYLIALAGVYALIKIFK